MHSVRFHIFKRLRACLISNKRFYCDNKPLVLTQKSNGILYIAINRPDKRNCVNLETASQLKTAFQLLNDDPTLKVGVLHGIGGNFCAGFDLEELSTGGINQDNIPKAPMGPSHMISDKPIIAAIEGYAVAGGLELALLCDMRIVEDTSILGVFCRRFGVPLIDGGTVRLPALIGLSRALDLILTGRIVKGKEAVDIGLASQCVNLGCAIGVATSVAKCIAKFPQECMKADRRSAYHSVFDAKSLQDALDFEYENGKSIIASESVEGAARFVKDGVGRHGKFQLDSRATMNQLTEPDL